MTSPPARAPAPGAAPARMTRRPSSPADLLASWRPRHGLLLDRGGLGVASAGVAASSTVAPGPDHVGRAARSVEALVGGVEGGVEANAVAVAAIPFAGDRAFSVTIPRRALLRRRGGAEEVVATGGETEPDGGPCAPGPPPRRRPPVRAEPTAKRYSELVAEALARIASGALSKVVLARTLVVGGAHDPRALLLRLRAADPSCYTIAAPASAQGEGVLVAASPEMLVTRRGREVRSQPLGGSAPRSAEAAEDRAWAARLLASAKERREHRLVVEAVADRLGPLCSELTVAAEPALVATAHVWHLGTDVEGRLRPEAPSALGLAAELHPTPAVAGAPTQAALATIAELEPVPRGLYAGLAGWVDARGDGEWALTLRCAEVAPDHLRLHAGAGIVADSDPAAEVAETEAKFLALLTALEEAWQGRR